MRSYLEYALGEDKDSISPLAVRMKLLHLEQKARASNMRILSASANERVLADLSKFLHDVESSSWPVGISRGKKFEGLCLTACVLGSFFRLVFRSDVPKNKLLVACNGPYDRDDFRRKLAPLYEMRERCASCVDRSFTGYYLDKCSASDAHCRRVYSLLHAAIPCFPCSSTSEERKHILGQEVRAKRRRGRAVSAVTLAIKTYRKTVQAEMSRQTKRVQQEVFGGPVPRGVIRMLAGLAQDRQVDRRRSARRMMTTATMKTNRASAYKSFRKAHWAAGINPKTVEGRSEEKRIASMWRARSLRQRQAYELDAADVRNREAAASQEAVGASMNTFGLSRSSQQRVARKRVLTAVESLKNHRLWQCGAKTMEYGLGLARGRVDETSTNEMINKPLAKSFSYDDRALDNPQSSPIVTVCSLRFGGLCAEDPLCRPADAIVKNLHALCVRHSITHESLPILLQGHAAGHALKVLIVFKYGKGEFFSAMPVDLEDGALWTYRLHYEATAHGLTCVCTSMHLLARRFLADILEEVGNVIHSFPVVLSKIVDDASFAAPAHGDRQFRFCAEELARGEVDTSSVMVARKAKARKGHDDDDVWMPFGFAAADPTREEAPADNQGPGSDMEHGDEKRGEGDDRSDSSDDGHGPGPHGHGGADEEQDSEPVEVDIGDIGDGDGDGPPLPPPPDPPAPRRRRQEVPPGLVGYGQAPSDRSRCFGCGDDIAIHSWRFQSVAPGSTTVFLRTRYFHAHCVHLLPQASRASDYNKINDWLRQPDLSNYARRVLENASDVLDPGAVGGASGSGG